MIFFESFQKGFSLINFKIDTKQPLDVTLLLNADCRDQMEEDLLHLLPITPFINPGLHKLWVASNHLTNWVILSGHQVVSFSKLQS